MRETIPIFKMLSETFKNCKDFFKENEKDIFLGALIVLVGFLSFGLGRLSRILENRPPLEIQNASEVKNGNIEEVLQGNASDTPFSASVLSAATKEGKGENGQIKNLVASKNGKKYYFPWCEGAGKIKEKNKVWFSSAHDARRAGYEPAKNCKGL